MTTLSARPVPGVLGGTAETATRRMRMLLAAKVLLPLLVLSLVFGVVFLAAA
jgi:hypothetical protein